LSAATAAESFLYFVFRVRSGLGTGQVAAEDRGVGAERLRIALVGCGWIGRVHAERLAARDEVQVVALCDPVKKRMAGFVREVFKPAGLEPALYSDYNRLLKRERLDGVVICTPHTLHFEQVSAALKAGVNVLVEKPMVTDSAHARQLADLAAEAGKVLAIAFQGPCSPEFYYIRRQLKQGTLGKVNFVQVVVGQGWQRAHVGTWRQDPKLSGGGMLYDSGAHALNAMIWLLDRNPEEVFAYVDNRGCPVDVDASITVRFADGALGSAISVGSRVKGIDSLVMIYGSDGLFRTGLHGKWLEQYDADGQQVRYPRIPYPDLTPVDNFVDAVLGRDKVRCGARYGVMLCDLMEAIYRSAQEGRPVKVGGSADAQAGQAQRTARTAAASLRRSSRKGRSATAAGAKSARRRGK